MTTLKDWVKTLLENVPELRDNSGELALHYKYTYMIDITWEQFTLDKMESKITRLSAEIQNENPNLRGARWLERQKFSKVIRTEKSRNQEKQENLSKTYGYEDKSHIFEKETTFQAIKRFFTF